jgi:branched-chain amino acid transport system permease protein
MTLQYEICGLNDIATITAPIKKPFLMKQKATHHYKFLAPNGASQHQGLHKNSRPWLNNLSLLLLGGIASFFIPKLFNNYVTFVLITLVINAILCVSLNLVNGYMGEFSVGHAAFMALGAYSSAIITVKIAPTLPVFFLFPVAVIVGGFVAALVGVPLALLSFKTRGDYLAIITLSFLMIVKSGLENITYVGGPRGFLGIPQLTTLPWAYFWGVFTFWISRNFINSKWGRSITAIREDEIAAQAMGVSTRSAKLMTFVISSFFAGVAGALFAQQIQFINPSSFDILKSTNILVMVYLGGVASLSGSLVGATVFTLLYQLLQPCGVWRMVIMPLLLVLLMIFRPRGIMGFQEWTWFELKERPNKRITPTVY